MILVAEPVSMRHLIFWLPMVMIIIGILGSEARFENLRLGPHLDFQFPLALA